MRFRNMTPITLDNLSALGWIDNGKTGIYHLNRWHRQFTKKHTNGHDGISLLWRSKDQAGFREGLSLVVWECSAIAHEARMKAETVEDIIGIMRVFGGGNG